MNDEETRITGRTGVDPTAFTRVPPHRDVPPGARAPSGPAEPPVYGIPPGTLLVNTYEVERLLGGGGMGEVYLARHAGLGTQHAVKVIRPSMAVNRQVMDLFYREAKVLRGVRHDAVVSYDGFVRDAEGRDYLVMEYVDGPSLAQRMRQGPLPLDEVLTLRDRLAAGLAEAHRRGAVHRDISPDNVVLPGNRVAAAKLIDFGLSKLTDPGEESIIGSDFAGKLRFASPEQFGLFGGVVDGRSDIYSLGLILAAAVLGRPLDLGTSFEAAVRNRQTVPDLGPIPPAMQPWLTAMLEPDPARRPKDLDALLAGWPAATRVGPLPKAAIKDQAPTEPSTPARPPRAWLLIGAVLVLVVAGGGGLYALLRPLEPAPPGPVSTGAQTKPAAPKPTAADIAGPGSPAGDLGALVTAGRYDDALTTARTLIATGPAKALPTGALLALAEHLRTNGRPQDAFILVEALIGAGTAPPPEAIWGLAQDLRTAGRLDPAFFLLRTLATQGHGPAAFALAELYDPLHWSAATSPFPKPRVDKARDWYGKAAERGVPAAAVRLDALKSVGAGE
ncbi:MAG TPA: protein kinase [Lamprocystis sp. (in: g-proteobacteria)]|nr:protein kinase [Lamprocystis sp. (in: g-proteobacteria)]